MTPEEKFHQALLDSGLVKRIKPRLQSQPRLPLVEVKGKAISETIIEGRNHEHRTG